MKVEMNKWTIDRPLTLIAIYKFSSSRTHVRMGVTKIAHMHLIQYTYMRIYVHNNTLRLNRELLSPSYETCLIFCLPVTLPETIALYTPSHFLYDTQNEMFNICYCCSRVYTYMCMYIIPCSRDLYVWYSKVEPWAMSMYV